tara:strand:+ start:140 stop:727 length:588 start_codon:yes stop_codon:yes gene_type:complete
LASGFFSKFFKNDPIERLWDSISSIKNLNENKVVTFKGEVGVMCWEKDDQIKVFCESKLSIILNDGVENSKTNFDLIDEKGEVFWIKLKDKNFNELISSVFTVVNALTQEINPASVMGLIFPIVVGDELNLSYLDKSQNHYLVFNENPLGYYPLIYKNGARQQIAETEIFDVIKNNGVLLNGNQSKWFGVDNLPF